MRIFSGLLVLLFCSISFADIAESLDAAIANEARGEKDIARDANRKPKETLEFFGLKEDMRVLELIPGGGWYTKILMPVLNDSGELLVALGTQNIEKSLVGQPGFENLTVIKAGGSFEREGRRLNVPGLTLEVSDLDMVLTFRNLHNLTSEARGQLNTLMFDALKSGGIYGVIDHTRRHMQADGDENWRRMDPILMIKEIEAAGFVFEDYSNLHYKLDDELRYEVGRKSVTGNTDRFTLKFRKP